MIFGYAFSACSPFARACFIFIVGVQIKLDSFVSQSLNGSFSFGDGGYRPISASGSYAGADRRCGSIRGNLDGRYIAQVNRWHLLVFRISLT